MREICPRHESVRSIELDNPFFHLDGAGQPSDEGLEHRNTARSRDVRGPALAPDLVPLTDNLD